MKEEDMREFIEFVEARQRLCERLRYVTRLQNRLQKLQIEALNEVSASSVTLKNIQRRHKTWKVGDDVKKLAREAGMLKIFANVDGEWLR